MENSQSSSEFQNQIMSNSTLINIENQNHEEKQKIIKDLKHNPKLQITYMYQNLFELYSQKQYKKIVKSIKLKSDKVGKFFLMEWKLLHLRMITLYQILDNKLALYYNSNKISHYSDYLQDINNEINNWIKLIEELIIKQDNKYKESFLEFIISFILKKCLIISKRFIHTGYIKDAITVLSLGVRIINDTIKFAASPDTFYLAGEIFLYLSSFMIAERNYKTAINLINLSINFSFKSLEIKLSKNNNNNYQQIFNLNNYEAESQYLYKIFFNLSTAFYQLSVCYENLNNSYKAYCAIKTSKFLVEFCNQENLDLYKDLIEKIEARLLMRNRIIIFFEKCVKKEDLDDNLLKSNSLLRKMISHEEKRQEKFNKLMNYLEKLKLIDADADEPDLFNRVGEKKIKPNVLKVTKQIQLLNYMMNDEFKDIVYKMKKIEINKPDKETINKIQKRIINIKNKQHFQLENKIQHRLRLKKKIDDLKNNNLSNSGKKDKEESDDKLTKSKTRNFNKSNVLKSTTFLSNSTTIPKKTNRVRSAFHRVDKKNLIKEINPKNNKPLTGRNSSKKISFTNFSMYSAPSRYLSAMEINNSNKTGRSKIFLYKNNNVFQKNNSINLKINHNINNNNINKNKTASKIKKNIFKYSSSKISTPKYICNKYYLTKSFRNKYSFLQSQFDKEIDFHKNLLKIKVLQEDLKKPQPPDLRKIREDLNNFFYSTYYNELMNAREKQIIFDKRDIKITKKLRTGRRFLSPEPQVRKLNLSDNRFLDTEEIYEMNERYINNMTNKIFEINKKQGYVKRMKKN